MYRDAAEQGIPTAQNLLGNCFEDGIGTPRDIFSAITQYRNAANQHFVPAQINLAYCLIKHTGEVEKGISWYERAAEAGMIRHHSALSSSSSSSHGVLLLLQCPTSLIQ